MFVLSCMRMCRLSWEHVPSAGLAHAFSQVAVRTNQCVKHQCDGHTSATGHYVLPRILSSSAVCSLVVALVGQAQTGRVGGGVQAQRLVKNSILAIEAPEEEVDDEDWVPDAEEVEEMVQRARQAEGDGPGSPDRSPGDQAPPRGPRSPGLDQRLTALPL